MKFADDGEPYVFHATAPEYVRQMETNKRLLDDEQIIEGVMDHGDGSISLVTSQKAIHGERPNQKDVEQSFREAGFLPVNIEFRVGQEGPEMWWNEEANIAVMDTKPEDLVKANNGEIGAIDVKAFEPTGKTLEWMKAHVDRSPPKRDYKAEAMQRQKDQAAARERRNFRQRAFMPEPDAPPRAPATGQPRPDVRTAAKTRLMARTPQDDRKRKLATAN